MPTSSQAMILRGTDNSRPVSVSLKSIVPFKIDTDSRQSAMAYSPKGNHGRCERVQFDFSVCAHPERTVSGFEGVFSYDQKSKSYRWQIYSVSPHKELDGRHSNRQDGGDHIDACETNEEMEPYILNQNSEYNGHFTTPTTSLIDATPDECNDEPHVHNSDSLNYINETEYRRLENLGFRRRTTYSSGGSLVKMQRGEQSPLKSPNKSLSEQLTAPKLAVNNLNKATLLSAKQLSDEFPPQPCVIGDSMRRRVPPIKTKSLLEEVKDSVRWSDRVSPSVGLNKSVIQPAPGGVCFSLEDSWKYDHAQVRDLIESQINCSVKTLQYDPLSVRNRDPEALDRWIVTFTSSLQCNKIIERGLAVGGKRVIVRSWEDVIREEMGEDWPYPCNFRLPNERHDRIIRKFLQSH